MASRLLNIAVVSDAVMPFNKGGKESRIFHLTTELAKLGHNVHIYTMKWWDGPQSKVIDGISYHAISKFYPLYSGNRRSIRQGILFAFSCFRLVRYDFDLLEVDHMPFLLLFPVKVISLLKRKPMFATWHEVWGTAYWREYLGRLGYLAAGIERLSVMLPDHITAVSPQTKQLLEDTLGYKGSIAVVPNGIHLQKIHAAKPSTPSHIIYVGRLIDHKNIDLLLESVALLKLTHPGIICHIIGDGPERKALQLQVNKLGIARNVRFAGFVPKNEDVYSAMKASKVFASPSTREGSGVSVLEAMACGLDIVTVNHPDNAARHVVKAAGGIVTDVNFTSFAAGLETALGSGKTSSSTARKYDWASLAVQMSKVYQQ